jgi:hypothetical protein
MDDLLIKGLEFIDRFFTKVAGLSFDPPSFLIRADLRQNY